MHGRRELWLIYVVTFLHAIAGDLFAGTRSALLRLVVAVVDAITFGVSALTLAGLNVHERRPQASRERFRTEFLAGIRHIAQTLGLRHAAEAGTRGWSASG